MLQPSAMMKQVPVLQIPPFKFENHVIDLQHIKSEKPEEGALQAEKIVEDFIAMRRDALQKKRELIVMFYANLHPQIKICFLQIVVLSMDKTAIHVAEKGKTFVPNSGSSNGVS